MSETEKFKTKESSRTSATAAVSSSSSAVYASRKVSNSNGRTSSSGSIKSSTAGASISVSRSTGSSSGTTKYSRKPPPLLHPPTPPVLKHLLPPVPVGRPRAQYHTPSAIRKAFLNFMKDPECLDRAANYLYESLLEDAVMGIYLEVHYSFKSGSMEAIEGHSEDDTAFKIVDTPNYDVFGVSKARKPMDCNCPNCDRLVAAIRFAPHLEKCMGMGRKTSRTASRRLANAKEGNTSYFSSVASDDDDDVDWSSEKRRKKITSSRTNGSKRNGKSSY